MKLPPLQTEEFLSGYVAEARETGGVFARAWDAASEHDRAAKFIWDTTAKTLAYSSQRIPEIADEIYAVDNAMKWGFANEAGPFEIWDMLGVAEDDAADLVLVEVGREAEHAARELEQLVRHRAREALHAGDAAAGLHDTPDLFATTFEFPSGAVAGNRPRRKPRRGHRGWAAGREFPAQTILHPTAHAVCGTRCFFRRSFVFFHG